MIGVEDSLYVLSRKFEAKETLPEMLVRNRAPILPNTFSVRFCVRVEVARQIVLFSLGPPRYVCWHIFH